ncbi:GFA family protein [Rhizobium sp. TRM95111]|uniref:GFA family protein n=1 Tax=Rhizobium alarense TaxID=2846851 RepID=UPI001F22F099|nr:GFA family protein [Rhizobium alarense]MCF3639917.1 GFA family protein [Rhizobium alarense]
MQRPYRLSCHCGSVRFEVDAELAGLTECNCSTCRRSGFLHWKVPATAVALVGEKQRLSTYVWRGLNEGHHFCPTCGIAVMRAGYPGDRVSVNARCIEHIDVFTLEIRREDGRNDMPPGPLP